MNQDFVNVVLGYGPQGAFDVAILLSLANQANDKDRVAVNPLELAKRFSTTERQIRRILRELQDSDWLRPIGRNAWQIAIPERLRSRARARATKDLNPSIDNPKHSIASTTMAGTSYNKNYYGKGNDSQYAGYGSGTRDSLGVENCPLCGGTGWEEVEPVKPGYLTVDVCHCRGGPDPKPTSVYPPREKRSGPHPQQIMRNLQGIERARSEMRNEGEEEARTSPLPPRSVAQDSEANPGEG
jgi:hypothetical protein